MSLRIYTRTGDEGDTGLFGGERVSKDDLRVEAYGAVDELNSVFGMTRTQPLDAELDELLSRVQHELFALGADLATPGATATGRGKVTIRRVRAEDVERLEAWIDRYEQELPPLTSFILPGGHPLAAHLHWCRVVCRRAERRCVSLSHGLSQVCPETAEPTTVEQDVNPQTLRYLNRLSDLLFVLARVANHRHGVSDVLWKNGEPR
jgi:cob(I)alamin adenosyltransferase